MSKVDLQFVQRSVQNTQYNVSTVQNVWMLNFVAK